MIVDQIAKRYGVLPSEVAKRSGEEWMFNIACFAWGLEADRLIAERIEKEMKSG